MVTEETIDIITETIDNARSLGDVAGLLEVASGYYEIADRACCNEAAVKAEIYSLAAGGIANRLEGNVATAQWFEECTERIIELFSQNDLDAVWNFIVKESDEL